MIEIDSASWEAFVGAITRALGVFSVNTLQKKGARTIWGLTPIAETPRERRSEVKGRLEACSIEYRDGTAVCRGWLLTFYDTGAVDPQRQEFMSGEEAMILQAIQMSSGQHGGYNKRL